MQHSGKGQARIYRTDYFSLNRLGSNQELSLTRVVGCSSLLRMAHIYGELKYKQSVGLMPDSLESSEFPTFPPPITDRHVSHTSVIETFNN